LCADHEEADKRLALHVTVNSCDTVVVSARDTVVLLLLVEHFPMPSANVRMMAGTAARRKFFNIRAISKNLPSGSPSALLSSHALTGCDTTYVIYLQPLQIFSEEDVSRQTSPSSVAW
jgi:uncharacterized protein YggU (UPF0235/DUF167 family)